MSRFLRLASMLAALLLLVLPFSAHGSTSAFDTVHALWVAETEGVLRLEIGSGEVLLTLPLDAPVRAVEVDLLRLRVWAVAGSKLHGYELDGSQFVELDLVGQTPAEVLLEVDPADGSLWIGIDRGLRNVSPAGQILLEVRLDQPLAGLAVDSTERRIWAATRKSVVAFDAVTGVAVETVALNSKAGVRDVDVSPDGALWVVLDGRVLRIEDDGTTLEASMTDAQKVAALDDGGAWVAGRKQVVLIAPDGALGAPVVPFAGNAVIQALVADPTDSSVWVANQGSVARVSAAGELLLAGELSRVWDLGLSADVIPPILTILAPPDGSWVTTKRPEVRIAFSDVGDGVEATGVTATSGGSHLAVSCVPVAEGEAVCRPDVDLPEGESEIDLVIVDKAGNRSEPASITLRVDTIPPDPVDLARVSVGAPENGRVLVSGEAGSVEVLVEVALTNVSGSASVVVMAGTDGSFEAELAAEAGDEIEIVLTDAAGNRSAASVIAVAGVDDLPPDPEEVATTIDRTVATDIATSTAFLYSGADPIQTGVVLGTIEPRRAAVLRGKVLDSTGAPLSGVRVTIHRHPEYGQTLSRDDGMFDLAVNGGGVLTVAYEKAALLPVQRRVAPAWRDFSWIEDVVMIPFDPEVTAVAANAAAVQVAAGSEVIDADGRRRAVVVFPASTGATLVMPDGSTQPLDNLFVRATEYTVGDSGPSAMPATLPETTGYTYAVELSVDQAIAVGARRVEFTQPVFHYVENFLDFPVGGIVPAGWYDRELTAWVPSENGRVIRLVGVADGLAEVDVDGTGLPASAVQLAALAFTDGELEELARRYQTGQSLWRTPIPHFTPWDCNWPFGPPLDAEPPPDPDTPVEAENFEGDPNDEPAANEDEVCRQSGFSTIECENQTLSQSYPIAGTPFSLNYHSDRVAGRRVSNSVRVRLSAATLPPRLKRIDLRIEVAGVLFQQSFAPVPDLSYLYTWAGHDAYGRELQGRHPATIAVGYVYEGVYYSPADIGSSFGIASGGVTVSGNRSNNEITLWRSSVRRLGHWENRALGLGGWQPGVQHAYDWVGGELLFGHGGQRTGMGQSIEEVSGETASDLEVAPDGSVYVLSRGQDDRSLVTRIHPDGSSELVAQKNFPGFSGIGLGPEGTLYYSTVCSFNGIVTRGFVMRDREGADHFGEDILIDTISFCPSDVAVGADGSLFIGSSGQIRRLWPNGFLTIIAGTGISTAPVTDGPALARHLRPVRRLAVGRDASVYFSEGETRVRRLRPDGFLETVAGTLQSGYDGEALPANASRLRVPGDIFIRRDGSLLIVDRFNHRLRLVTRSGLLITVAGDGTSFNSGNGGLARAAGTAFPSAVAEREDGVLYMSDSSGLRKISQIEVGVGESTLVPDAPGRELYEFDLSGRHQRTLDSATGATRLQFVYDDEGRLAQLVDAFGNVTRIERGSDGTEVSVVAPFGQRTKLEISTGGYLASITNPNHERVRFEYGSGGLLLTKRDALDQPYTYRYSSLGRLVSVTDPAGGGRLLERALLGDGYEVRSTTAGGRTTSYRFGSRPDGTRIRSVGDAAGRIATSVTASSGASTQIAASGVLTTVVEAPDPRFSMSSPLVKSVSTQLPSGLRSVTTFNRSVSLASPTDPLSVQRLSDEWIVNGRTYRRTFDTLEGRVELESPAGRRSYHLRDQVGRLMEFGSGAVEPTRLEYDDHGRLAALRRGSGDRGRKAVFSYSQSGFLEAVTDPLGRVISFERDSVGRPLTHNLPSGESISFEYDAAGRVQEVKVSETKGHRFSFTAVGLLSAYGSLGVESQTRLQYGFDRLLDGIVLADGTTIDATYDHAGRIVTMAMPNGTYTYSYTGAGQLELSSAPGGISIEHNYDGPLQVRTAWTGPVSGEITRTFDDDFRLTSQLVPGSDMIELEHDLDGLLTRAGHLQVHRSSEHALVEGTSVGSVHTSNSYNEFGDLSGWKAKFDGQELISTTLQHDNFGRLIEKLEAIDGRNTTWSYTYDLAGRLAGVHRDGTIYSSYEYDVDGNRIGYMGPFGELTASYGSDGQLDSYGDSTYSFDPLGRLTERMQNGHSISFSYDVLGNLRRVEPPSGVVTEYLIDPEQRRVGKMINGALVQGLLYKDRLNPIAEVDADGQIQTLFVYGTRGYVPDYMVRDGSVYRIISDHLGSPRIVIDATTGVVAQRLDYDEFGRILFDSNPGFQPFGFGGGVYDAGSGLVRFGVRDYDPIAGRWTALDPLHVAGGDINLYTYAHNDPVNLADPTGLSVFYCGITGEVVTPSTATAVGDAFIWIDSDGSYGTGVAGGLGGGVGSPGLGMMFGFSTAPTGAAYAGEGGQASVSAGVGGGGVTRSGSKFWGLEATFSPLEGGGGYAVETGTLIQKRGNLGDDWRNFERAVEENWERLIEGVENLVDPSTYFPELVPSDECGSCQ